MFVALIHLELAWFWEEWVQLYSSHVAVHLCEPPRPPLACSHFGGALAEPDSFPGRSLLRGRQHSIQHRPLEKASDCFSGF